MRPPEQVRGPVLGCVAEPGVCCVAGRTHLPFSNLVPAGQQLGGVPTGRSPEHLVGPLALPGCTPLAPPPPARHLPSLKDVPRGQQLG